MEQALLKIIEQMQALIQVVNLLKVPLPPQEGHSGVDG